VKCPYLIGENIYLRPLNPEDLKKGYLKWINNPEINRYLMVGTRPTSFPKLCEYYEKIMKSDRDVMFAIVVKKTDKHIGNIKIGDIDWINRHANCGRLIGDKRYWDKGYGTEALRLVIDYAFNTLNLNRVYTGALVDNVGAIKSCERVGMKKEGAFSQYCFIGGEYKDVVQLAITRDRYNKLRKR
jgi:RimJ/RimL family protein N-acetyltransferase